MISFNSESFLRETKQQLFKHLSCIQAQEEFSHLNYNIELLLLQSKQDVEQNIRLQVMLVSQFTKVKALFMSLKSGWITTKNVLVSNFPITFSFILKQHFQREKFNQRRRWKKKTSLTTCLYSSQFHQSILLSK